MPEQDARRPLATVARRVVRSVARRGRAEPEAAVTPVAPVAPPPRLSVVVPVYNVAQYLPECLDSILRQTLTNLEVIAVDDGSSDGSADILAEYAARDPRLRVLTQANAGAGVARNRGVEAARGEFLTFCDADDTLPPRAYNVMVRTLVRSGSDFVVGATRRAKHGRPRQVAWGDTVHEFDRISTTIDEFPAALQDIIACNRVFRTDFWRERVGGFEEGTAYEDHLPMLAAYVRADRFDVLAMVTYWWRMREDQTSTGQQKADLQNLRDRVAVKERAFALLQAEASPAAYDTWVGRCLDIDFPPFLRHASSASPEYREVLATTYRTFLDRSSDRALRTVRHPRLVRAWLCAGRHWDELAAVDAWFAARRPPVVRVEGDQMFAVPDLPASVTDLIPASAWALAESETALRTAVHGVHRDGTILRVDGYALVAGLDSSTTAADLDAWLVEDDGERRLDVPVHTTEEQDVDLWFEDGVGHAHSGFVASIDLTELGQVGTGVWRLRLRLRHGQVARESGVYEAVPGSGAEHLRREVIELDGMPMRVEPVWDPAGGFQIAVAPASIVVDELEPPDGLTLRGRVRGTGIANARVVLRADGDRSVAAVVAEDGSFSLPLPGAGHTWSLRARDRQEAAPQPALWTGADRTIGEPGPGQVVWQAAADGGVLAVPDGRSVRVERVEMGPDTIVTEVSTTGVSVSELGAAVWRTRHLELPVSSVEAGAETVTLTFPVRLTPAAHGVDTLAPSGTYVLLVRAADGRELKGLGADGLARVVPRSHLGTNVRLSVRLRKDRTVVVDLGGPLDDQERTQAFQEQLRRAHHEVDAAATGTPAVLLHVAGPTAGLLSLASALTHAHPDVERLWAVQDRSVRVPEGATPVLIGSRQWYDALGRSSALWTAGDLPDYVDSGPGQRSVQIFEGFPVRRVGRSLWRARGLAAPAVELKVARRRQQWDTIVAPNDAVADVYRREFDFDGTVLVTGHPRCDDLVTRDRASVRSDVLRRLGVPDDHTVVLHSRARHDRATQALLARSPAADLDLVRLAGALGPGHVILTLGVPHVARAADTAARTIDATTYPAVNDLLLAADVAVLDYDDLRFDWALTGRPAIFHVPDHDAYVAAVPAPISFDETSPGPHLGDTDAVIEAVRERAGLQQEYAAAVAELNRTFNALHDGHAGERVVAAVLR